MCGSHYLRRTSGPEIDRRPAIGWRGVLSSRSKPRVIPSAARRPCGAKATRGGICSSSTRTALTTEECRRNTEEQKRKQSQFLFCYNSKECWRCPRAEAPKALLKLLGHGFFRRVAPPMTPTTRDADDADDADDGDDPVHRTLRASAVQQRARIRPVEHQPVSPNTQPHAPTTTLSRAHSA